MAAPPLPRRRAPHELITESAGPVEPRQGQGQIIGLTESHLNDVKGPPPAYDEVDLARLEAGTQKLQLGEKPRPEQDEDFDEFEEEFVEFSDEAVSEETSNSPTSPTKPTDPAQKSKWKTALQATSHFAGGLIPHPSTSTKRFTILRHSTGVVLYRGPSTCLAVTIFSTDPLPADRTLWLQRKGWTGNRGLKAKAAVGLHGGWIDVTPQREVSSGEVSEADEKAWRRDIDKFLRKAAKSKGPLRKHVARETCIVRIPFESDDGYFRIALCSGSGGDGSRKNSKKKVLCPSPAFRVASLSTSSTKFKGASLSTLPVEIGIKALSTIGMSTAGEVAAPVMSAVQSRIGQYMPGSITQTAAKTTVGTAYEISGAKQKLQQVNQTAQQRRDMAFGLAEGDVNAPDSVASTAESSIVVVGDDGGPSDPFPLALSAKIVPGRGAGQSQPKDAGKIPSARLSGVREELKTRLSGVYFAWAQLSPQSKNSSPLPEDWLPALITASPREAGYVGVVPKTDINAYIIHDFGESSLFYGAKISVLVMGFLRPCLPVDQAAFPPSSAFKGDDEVPQRPDTKDTETRLMQVYADAAVAQQSLMRPDWSAEVTLQRMKEGKGVTDKLVTAREFSQRQVERVVRVEKVGVRVPALQGLRDQAVGIGGLYIRRDL